MEPKKTLKEVENAVVKRDGLAMTVRKVLEIFGVMKSTKSFHIGKILKILNIFEIDLLKTG